MNDIYVLCQKKKQRKILFFPTYGRDELRHNFVTRKLQLLE